MSKLARISSSSAVPSLLILKKFHHHPPSGHFKCYRKFEEQSNSLNYSIYKNVSPQVHHQQKQAPCRTCTDFKTWTKIQQKDISFKTDSELLKTYKFDSVKERQESCPIDKDELGRSTWNLLHTMAANYPDKPSQEDASTMKTFFNAFSKIYPCELCAKDFREELKLEPPDLSSQENMSQWLCRLHNRVNIKIGKPIFDCSMVNERWKDGWKDGSCD